MPRGDRTGPAGMGAMTGRAAGYCGRLGPQGCTHRAPGRGAGMGCGRGRGFGGGRRGWRNMFYDTGYSDRMRFGGCGIPYGYPAPYGKPDPEFEKKALKNQAETLQAELALINKRLGEVETESAAN
jgi:hypothetical protein